MKLLSVFFTAIFLYSLVPSEAHSASQDECAIWLCLPGGFPQGCAGAYAAYLKRIKKLKPPLPSFSACSVGSSSGRYKTGVELYHECPAGYMAVDQFSTIQNKQVRYCLEQSCVEQYPQTLTLLSQGFETTLQCELSYAQERQQQQYIEMWVDDEYLGKFFYQ